MSKCQFYQTKTERYKDKQRRRMSSRPPYLTFTFNWCSHENSPHREYQKGELTCNGDIAKCPLKNQ